MLNHSPIIAMIIKACDRAATMLVRDFAEVEKLQISKKGVNDFVTRADTKAEKMLVSELHKGKPQFQFLVEEGGSITFENDHPAQPIRYRWIIDPIDGTMNFMHGHQHFCISVALEKQIWQDEELMESDIIAGVIYAPVAREIYWAEKGKGAYCIDQLGNQSRIRVSNKSQFAMILCAVSNLQQFNIAALTPVLSALKTNNAKFRISGSMALDLAYVASGRFDVAVHSRLHLWDVAAGSLLVKEAGGAVSSLEGKSTLHEGDSIIASNSFLYKKLLSS